MIDENAGGGRTGGGALIGRGMLMGRRALMGAGDIIGRDPLKSARGVIGFPDDEFATVSSNPALLAIAI